MMLLLIGHSGVSMYYIYKITNKITGKIYVGRGTIRTKTYGPEHDHYYGSGRVIKRS